ncbi:hypothetical protein DICPUDRAFT_76648 [Dictyostelium purpureum]|uniref:Uncharacterized protein n=1 Tax=Dictyostelium purpureum TaxID=5786 RepID=F0ZE52_DICPU|nr:uncharacterized protein DICPUDRAFT_76648 [Dictyostelium purpureum]EGC37788.1 hypothetical protein DICPUDRAFT_76648 [Dictyostelium purpureum]|eukprot:XP_003285727.1 hypothetical protein DICPUDRAFT_76648 [Dictyostelium purpureum]
MDGLNFKNQTNFKSGTGRNIVVESSSLDKARVILSNSETNQKSPNSKSKRTRDFEEESENNNNINNINNNHNNHNNTTEAQENKLNKINNKEKTGFKTASNHSIIISKHALNKYHQEINNDFEKDIDLSQYQADIQLLEQPLNASEKLNNK